MLLSEAQAESPDHLSCTVMGAVTGSTPTRSTGSWVHLLARKRCCYQERADGLPKQKVAPPSRVPLEVGIRFGGGEEELPFLLGSKTNIFGYFNPSLSSVLDPVTCNQKNLNCDRSIAGRWGLQAGRKSFLHLFLVFTCLAKKFLGILNCFKVY